MTTIQEKKQIHELDLQSLTEGCTKAIVTYSLQENCFAPNGFTKHKIVVFIGDGFCPETVNKHISDMLVNHNHSFVKSYLFLSKMGTWIKSKVDLFKALLLQDIFGIIPSNDIIDCRKKGRKFNNRRA